MQIFNALVTRTDLTTMGLAAKGSPATGNQIATKQFINDNYYVDPTPLSTYATNQCPPYQTIVPFYPSTFVTLVSNWEIQVSGDNGNTWTNKSPFGYPNPTCSFRDISMSSSGQYQTTVADQGYITYSQNFGSSFVQNTAAGNRRWTCVAVSRYTGQYQIAGVNGGNLANLYRSTNYGTTWSVISGFTGFWNSVAISGNGQYQLSGDSIDGYLYVSSNYGANWTAKTSTGKYWWEAFAISGNGQYQYAMGYLISSSNYYIFISSNYGSTWSLLSTGPSIEINGSPPNITTNETGQYVTIGKDSTLYRSSNYGASFTTLPLLPLADSITSVKMTSSGQQQVISIVSSVSTVSYYMSVDYGVTWTPNTTLAGGYGSIDISDSTGGTTTTTTTPPPSSYNYYDVTRFNCPTCSGATGGYVARNNTTGGILTNGYYYNNGDGYVYRIDGYNAGPSYTIDLDGSASDIDCSTACSI